MITILKFHPYFQCLGLNLRGFKNTCKVGMNYGQVRMKGGIGLTLGIIRFAS